MRPDINQDYFESSWKITQTWIFRSRKSRKWVKFRNLVQSHASGSTRTVVTGFRHQSTLRTTLSFIPKITQILNFSQVCVQAENQGNGSNFEIEFLSSRAMVVGSTRTVVTGFRHQSTLRTTLSFIPKITQILNFSQVRVQAENQGNGWNFEIEFLSSRAMLVGPLGQ